MKLLGDKIFVRFTNESIESIYRGKEITRDDGSKVRLFLTWVDAKHDEDRKASLFIQTAIVEAVGEDVVGVEVGDTAIVNYDLINLTQNVVYFDDKGITYWLNGTTTYHNSTLTAYANRQSSRDQIVYQPGDYEEISLLLGLVRDDKLIARDPYVFIDHESNVIEKTTESGIIYSEVQKYIERRVLAVSDKTNQRHGTKQGDKILMSEKDIFEVRVFDKSIDCIYDIDVIAKVMG